MFFESRRQAFTIVELLVVIAITGIIIALSLPAVFAVRDAARMTHCKNNLRQVGLAAIAHHDAHSHFPTGGWGYRWVGDPDRGFGVDQPGGWIVNLLPYTDEHNLYEQPRGLSGNDKMAALARLVETPITLFNCPSRRDAEPYPYTALRHPCYGPNSLIGFGSH